MFYLYPERPDINWFVSNRAYKLSVVWWTWQISKNQAYIQIKDQAKTADFQISPSLEKFISESCVISYPSFQSKRDEKVIFTTPEWDIFQLFPQSEMQIEFWWKDLISLTQTRWKVWFFSWLFQSDVQLNGSFELLKIEQNPRIESIQGAYNRELVDYLKNQISENNIGFVSSKMMQHIDWKILKYLARMFPTLFAKNLSNFYEFQRYFKMVEVEKSELNKYSEMQMSWWVGEWFWWSLKNNMKIWGENLYGIKKPDL